MKLRPRSLAGIEGVCIDRFRKESRRSVENFQNELDGGTVILANGKYFRELIQIVIHSIAKAVWVET